MMFLLSIMIYIDRNKNMYENIVNLLFRWVRMSKDMNEIVFLYLTYYCDKNEHVVICSIKDS